MTVVNGGPSAAGGATVTDVLPAGAMSLDWTCTATSGSSCTDLGSSAISDTIDLAPGGTATYQVTVATSSAAVGTLTNVGSVGAPPGVVDPVPGNNIATDIDTLVPSSDLSITKSDGNASAIPGTSVTYSIVATNVGPSDAVGSSITDVLPPILTGATWSCVAAGGATCTAAGSGNIADIVDIPVGGSVTSSVTAAIVPTARGTLDNTASSTVAPGATDPVAGNNSATDSDVLSPHADLIVTKSDEQASMVPGTPVTYTVVATHLGPSSVSGATVTDPLPAALLSGTWTCTSTGASCPASGTGDLLASIDLPVNGTATFTVTGRVSPSATGVLANNVAIAPPIDVTDPFPGNDTASDLDTLKPEADLSITKTDGLASAQPGDVITYTVVASNAGPSAVSGAPVADELPAGLTAASWTCLAGASAACTASGSGDVDTTVDLGLGSTATFTVTATVAATAGAVTNSAAIDAPTGVHDGNTANNLATDTTSITPTADLSITKTDGLTTIAAGEALTYTISIRNSGPSTIFGAAVDDPLDVILRGATWTCAASGGSACGDASGTGGITELVDLA